jgi:hypothetical protein
LIDLRSGQDQAAGVLSPVRAFGPGGRPVLEEAVTESFEEGDAVPFMMQVFQIREKKRKSVPAVTLVDGSGANGLVLDQSEISPPEPDTSRPDWDTNVAQYIFQ